MLRNISAKCIDEDVDVRKDHLKPFFRRSMYSLVLTLRAWRGTNRAVKALGDDYLGTMSLDAPVLIVQGEQDVIRETNAVLAARFPTAPNVRIPDTGHFPWVEEPAVFSKTLLDFYSRVSSAAPA